MRVKICGIQNEAELLTAVDAGADMVGFQVGQLYAAPTFVLPSTARRLAEVLPIGITPVLVTHYSTAQEIFETCNHTGITTVQISNCTVEETARLRDMLGGGAKIIYTEYIHDPMDELVMAELLPLIDAINLDCCNPSRELVGTESLNSSYEWGKGRDYIAEAQLKVMLSGRLSADNVAEAIGITRPFAVDACTLLKNGERVLDKHAACEYVFNCKQEFFKIKEKALP